MGGPHSMLPSLLKCYCLCVFILHSSSPRGLQDSKKEHPDTEWPSSSQIPKTKRQQSRARFLDLTTQGAVWDHASPLATWATLRVCPSRATLTEPAHRSVIPSAGQDPCKHPQCSTGNPPREYVVKQKIMRRAVTSRG